MIFWLKKLIAPFLSPLAVAMLLLGVGVGLLWWRKGRSEQVGRWLVTAALAWLVMIASMPFGGVLIARLEYKYPALENPAEDPLAAQARYVVVLGGGHSHGEGLPPTSELNLVTLARAVEAVRLYQALPEVELIFSGGSVYNADENLPNAEVLAAAAQSLGVPPEKCRVSANGRDTKDEAREIAGIVGKEPFILVTSASHMPRAIALFRKQGMDPIPAPTGHRTRRAAFQPTIGAFFPNSGRIAALERAIHEYLGLIWGKLRKQL